MLLQGLAVAEAENLTDHYAKLLSLIGIAYVRIGSIVFRVVGSTLGFEGMVDTTRRKIVDVL